MDNKIQVELALNSDRFNASMRNEIYSVNLFTNAVLKAGSALRKLERPIKISIKEDVVILQKIVRTFMDDTSKDLDDTIKKIIKVNENLNIVKTNNEKISQKVSIKSKTSTSNKSGKKCNCSSTKNENKPDSNQNKSGKKEENKGEAKKGDFLSNLSEKLKKLEDVLNKIKDTYDKLKSVIDFIKGMFGGNKGKTSKSKKNTPKGSKKGNSSKTKKSKNGNKKSSKGRKGNTKGGNVAKNTRSTGNTKSKVKAPKAKTNGKSKTQGKAPKGSDLSSIAKGAEKAMNALSKLSKVGGTAFKVLGKAFGVFKLAFKAIPIIGQIMTIIDIIQTLKDAWDNNFLGIKTITLKVWDWIKTKISSITNVFETVKTSCSNFVNKVGEMWGKVKEFFKNPIKGVVDFFASGSAEGKSRAFGQRVIPYDNFPILAHQGESLLTANETRRLGSGSVVVSKLADTLVVREEADIDRIANSLVSKLDKVRFNMG